VSAITNIEAGIPINAAMALLPLVVVAWSDGDVSEKEREAIHKAVSELDIALDPTLHQVFTNWLETRPRSQAVAAWKDYVKAISAVLNFEDGNRLERAIMGRADEVAHAAGAILGFGNKLSSAEQACLDDLAGAFGRTA
jgi:predicted hotdog family 3-hydroxylacyl-ACP dehydratase